MLLHYPVLTKMRLEELPMRLSVHFKQTATDFLQLLWGRQVHQNIRYLLITWLNFHDIFDAIILVLMHGEREGFNV